MLHEKTTAHKYKVEFNSRFSNFCQKTPMLLSFIVEENTLKVIDEATNMVYSFDWDLTIPIKRFIHRIKEVLLNNGCYPTLIRTMVNYRNPTPEEIAEEMANGVPIKKTTIKIKITKEKRYIIDKIIILKELFILRDLETEELFQYKLHKKSILFLRKLRANKLTEKEAGNIFFTEAQFVKKLNSKKEE